MQHGKAPLSNTLPTFPLTGAQPSTEQQVSVPPATRRYPPANPHFHAAPHQPLPPLPPPPLPHALQPVVRDLHVHSQRIAPIIPEEPHSALPATLRQDAVQYVAHPRHRHPTNHAPQHDPHQYSYAPVNALAPPNTVQAPPYVVGYAPPQQEIQQNSVRVYMTPHLPPPMPAHPVDAQRPGSFFAFYAPQARDGAPQPPAPQFGPQLSLQHQQEIAYKSAAPNMAHPQREGYARVQPVVQHPEHHAAEQEHARIAFQPYAVPRAPPEEHFERREIPVVVSPFPQYRPHDLIRDRIATGSDRRSLIHQQAFSPAMAQYAAQPSCTESIHGTSLQRQVTGAASSSQSYYLPPPTHTVAAQQTQYGESFLLERHGPNRSSVVQPNEYHPNRLTLPHTLSHIQTQSMPQMQIPLQPNPDLHHLSAVQIRPVAGGAYTRPDVHGNVMIPTQGYMGQAAMQTVQQQTPKKRRLQWTPELHKKFELAIEKLGIDEAVPKTLLREMNVSSLTRENVASHLQKYREMIRKKKAGEGKGQESPSKRARGSSNPHQPSSSGRATSDPQVNGRASSSEISEGQISQTNSMPSPGEGTSLPHRSCDGDTHDRARSSSGAPDPVMAVGTHKRECCRKDIKERPKGNATENEVGAEELKAGRKSRQGGQKE